MTFEVRSPYAQLFELDGTPLDSGYVYVGQVYQNPITNPVQCYFDAAKTIPAAQPLRTEAGYIVRNGAPTELYVDSDYSILVQNRKKKLVFFDEYTKTTTDSVNISFTQTGAGGVERPQQEKSAETLSVDDFIPTGINTAITDCRPYIQAAIIEAFTSGRNIKNQRRVYGVSAVVLIPNQPTFTKLIEIDFGGSEFRMLADTTVFSSAYYNAGVLTSNYGTPLMSHPTTGVKFGNFVLGTTVGNTTAPALTFQDWYQDTRIHDIRTNFTELLLKSNNNFYCEFENIGCVLNTVSYAAGPCFIWEGNHNLNLFRAIVATNFTLQQRFDGPVTSSNFEKMSVEGVTNGLEFNSDVYGLTFDGYFENFKRVFNFNAQSIGCKITSGYVNYLNDANAYLVKHLPGPANQIDIDLSAVALVAMPSERQIFETLDNTQGYNMMSVEKPTEFANFIDFLLVDNTKVSAEVTWKQVMNGPAGRAHKVNKFAVGNYSGMYADGYAGRTFYQWINNSNSTLTIRTKMTKNATQRVYVNIIVYYNTGVKYFIGEFIGDDFWEFGASFTKTNALTASLSGTDLQINGASALPGLITDVKGEIRLV